MRHLPSAEDLQLKAEDLQLNPSAVPTSLHPPAAEVQRPDKIYIYIYKRNKLDPVDIRLHCRI